MRPPLPLSQCVKSCSYSYCCYLPTQTLNRALNESKRERKTLLVHFLFLFEYQISNSENQQERRRWMWDFSEKMGNSNFNVASVRRVSLGENKIYCDFLSLSSKIEKSPRAEAEIHISFTSMLRNVVCVICPFPKLRRVSQCKTENDFYREKEDKILDSRKCPKLICEQREKLLLMLSCFHCDKLECRRKASEKKWKSSEHQRKIHIFRPMKNLRFMYDIRCRFGSTSSTVRAWMSLDNWVKMLIAACREKWRSHKSRLLYDKRNRWIFYIKRKSKSQSSESSSSELFTFHPTVSCSLYEIIHNRLVCNKRTKFICQNSSTCWI